jgi:hypothetical protein
LDVSSVVGEGSSFSVAVPIGHPIEEAMPIAVPKAAGPLHRDPVILFVDDDPAIVDATTMMLELSGIKVETALDGNAAIDMLESGLRADMVISDYRLPGANGVEVIRRAHDLGGTEVPAVIMTGDTSSKVIEDAKLANCIVLRKPVDTDHLIELIEASLNPEEQALQ